MERWILREDIRREILTDPVLYGKVAKAIDVKATSMPRIIYGNSPKLTQYTSLQVISKYLKKSQRELIELEKETV